MKSRLCLVAACAAFLTCGTSEVSAGLVYSNSFTEWDFTTTSALNNSPAPTSGSGTATVLGMTNSYLLTSGSTITGSGTFTGGTTVATSSTAGADITATPGDPNGLANAWRVRGNGSGSGNGWALQAPQDTQGAQFSASTVGHSNIYFAFDWFTTTQGVNKLQEQYTLDGTTWNNINSPLTAVSNNFVGTPLTINFSGISGVANDPNFGVRLVSVYDTSLNPANYGSADGGQNGVYNNNSGNWRFTAVAFTSGAPAAVPEPSSVVLTSIAGGIVLAFARRRRSKV